MPKRRILLAGEATYLSSGYAKYGREVFNRLYKTGKYELAEFAAYGKVDDIRNQQVPWKFYANLPESEHKELNKLYKQDPINQFGKWRFDLVLLDFKPDIVWSFRDFWMDSYHQTSPLRPFFHYCTMPTVDSKNQQREWIDSYIKADSVFTYSDFGYDVLRKEGNGKIKLHQTASMGINPNHFKPIGDKVKHRTKYGLHPQMNIVGTVMRNQKRKLFPDLFDGFSKFLNIAYDRHPSLAQNTFLYLHTSLPDNGSDLWEITKQYGLSHKILLTYVCRSCGHWFPSFFHDAKTVCVKCKQHSAVLPSVTNGVSEDSLVDIYNLFDLYIQYAICGGLEIPPIEAASCGIPVMETDYSAMSTVVKKLDGQPLRVERFFREFETGMTRCYPDNQYLGTKIYEFFTSSDVDRQEKKVKARKAAIKHFSWNNIINIWDKHFDSIALEGLQGQWDNTPARLCNIHLAIPEKLTHHEFIEWCVINILREDPSNYTYLILKLTKFLFYEAQFTGGGQGIKPFNRNTAINIFKNMASHKNQCEQIRCNMISRDTYQFIEYANREG